MGADTLINTYANPTLLDSLDIWAGLSLSTLESGGRAADTETSCLK